MTKIENETSRTNAPRDRKLDEIYDMVKENNEVLNSLLKRERISNFFKVLYWGFIIATALGVYYKFDFILEYLLKYFMKMVDPNNNFGSINASMPQIKNLMDIMQGIKSN